MEKKIIQFVIERIQVEQEAAECEKNNNFYGADVIRERFWWGEEFDNFVNKSSREVYMAYKNLLDQCMNEAYNGTGFDAVIKKLNGAE
jgi:hypothetical protein|nr:MAG TPA: hypothetical protein [Caudoviricetes sp.]